MGVNSFFPTNHVIGTLFLWCLSKEFHSWLPEHQLPFGNAEEVGSKFLQTVVDINLGHKPEPGGLGCGPNETKLWPQFHH